MRMTRHPSFIVPALLLLLVLGSFAADTQHQNPTSDGQQHDGILFTSDCQGRLHFLPRSALAVTVDLSHVKRGLDGLLDRIRDRVSCKCSGANAVSDPLFRALFNPVDSYLAVRPDKDIDLPPCLGATRTMQALWRLVFASSDDGDDNSASKQQPMPSTCDVAKYLRGETCAFSLDNNVKVAIAQCPGNTHWRYISVSGTALGQTCSSDLECGQEGRCIRATEDAVLNVMKSVLFMFDETTTVAEASRCLSPGTFLANLRQALKTEDGHITAALDSFLGGRGYCVRTGKSATAGGYTMSAWDGILASDVGAAKSVFLDKLMTGTALTAGISEDPVPPKTTRLFKLGCDTRLQYTHYFTMQGHRFNTILNTVGQQIAAAWMCRLRESGVVDVNELEGVIVPDILFRNVPWNFGMWVWGLTATRAGLGPATLGAPLRNFVRQFFDPSMYTPGPEPPRPVPPMTTSSSAPWKYHPQSPPPLFIDRSFTLEVPCQNPETGERVTSAWLRGFEMMRATVLHTPTKCVARIPKNMYEANHVLCVDPGNTCFPNDRIPIIMPNNTDAIGGNLRLRVASTCSEQGFRVNGSCAFSLVNLLGPRTTVQVHVSSCSESLRFGHSSVDVSCQGSGCRPQLCRTSSDCENGYKCTEIGSMLMGSVTEVAAKLESDATPEMIKMVLNDADVLGALLWGGVKNVNNLTQVDVTGAIISLHSTAQCWGPTFHKRDVITFYNLLVEDQDRLPLDTTASPSFCYSPETLRYSQTVIDATTTTNITEDDAACTDATLCPFTFRLPGMQPHSPWRTDVPVISLRSTEQLDILSDEELVAKAVRALGYSMEDVEIVNWESTKGKAGVRSVQFSFAGLSDPKAATKMLMQKDADWWKATVGLNSAPQMSTSDGTVLPPPSAAASTPTSSPPHEHHHNAVAIVLGCIFPVAAVVVAVVYLVRRRNSDDGAAAGGFFANIFPRPFWRGDTVVGTHIPDDDDDGNEAVTNMDDELDDVEK
eukprot:PhM_4_TR14406/c0_g1_i1/m.20601